MGKDTRKTEEKRPSWDEYFMGIMKEVGKRGTCDRGRSGALAVKEKRILATGYVGSPVGLPHCDEAGHLMKATVHEDGSTHMHCVRTVHAEQNVISQAAKNGVSLEGATIYCKMTPCFACAKMIINSGIRRVVCEKRYHEDKDSVQFFKHAGVKLNVVNNEVEEYAHQKVK